MWTATVDVNDRWVLNTSLQATHTDEVRHARAQLDSPHIRRVANTMARRLWLTAWDPPSPNTLWPAPRSCPDALARKPVLTESWRGLRWAAVLPG